MAKAWVEINHEVKAKTSDGKITEAWVLCFQHCTYHFDDDTYENGYRFIWRRPNSSLQAARGQARIPSIAHIKELVDAAVHEGWGKESD